MAVILQPPFFCSFVQTLLDTRTTMSFILQCSHISFYVSTTVTESLGTNYVVYHGILHFLSSPVLHVVQLGYIIGP